MGLYDNPTTRRRFLKVSGFTAAGAAFLAACGKSKIVVSNTGTTVSTSVPPTAAPPSLTAEDKANDATLLRTATSLELLLVDVYGELGPKATDPQLEADLAQMRDHHTANVATFQGATTKAGGTAFDQPNAYVRKTVVDPALAGIRDDSDVIGLARQLEDLTVSSYTQMSSTLGTPDLRATTMSVGAVSARHVAVLDLAAADGDITQVAGDAFYGTRDAVGSAAYAK